MLRFVVAGMAVVILALAGATGFLAYENLSEDDGGGATVQPTGWDAVSYEGKHEICYEFATFFGNEGLRRTDDDKYQACMDCGPEKVRDRGGSLFSSDKWYCGR